jgi:hypothetical protein
LKRYFFDIAEHSGVESALGHLHARKVIYQMDLRRGRLPRELVESVVQELDEIARSLVDTYVEPQENYAS